MGKGDISRYAVAPKRIITGVFVRPQDNCLLNGVSGLFYKILNNDLKDDVNQQTKK